MDRRAFLLAAAAAPAAARAALAAAAGPALVLVTADLESHVAVVDAATGRVVRRIPTRDGPRSIEAVGRTAVVAHTALGAVSLLDGPHGGVRRVLDGFDEPRYTAGAPDGRRAWVTDSGRGEVVEVDLGRDRAARRLELGGPARHIGRDATGRTLWVALGTKARALAVVDAAGGLRLVRRVVPPFLAHDVGFAPGGGTVWVTSGDGRRLALYAARTGRLLTVLGAGSPPQHVAFAAGRAFVASGMDGTVAVHALDGRRIRRTRVPVGSYNVQRSGRIVVTPSLDRGTLAILGLDGRVAREVRVARSSHDACVMR